MYVEDAPYLLIDARRSGGPLLRVSPWEAGLRLQRFERRFVVDDRDFDPLHHTQVGDVVGPADLDAFWQTIPSSASTRVSRDMHLGLTVLRCIGRSTRFVELMDAHPTLAWLVAARLAHRPDDRNTVHSLASLPRRQLLGYALCSPDEQSESSVRFLRRIAIPTRDARALDTVRRALRSPVVVAALRHRPIVKIEDLELLLAYPSLATRRWLRDALEYDGNDRLSAIERTLQHEATAAESAALLDLPDDGRAFIARATTMRAVRTLCDRWFRRVARVSSGESASRDEATTPFPPPPLQGSPTIEPITSRAELVTEGRTMRHCIASYARDVRRGERAVYRVLAPERATLCLRVGPPPTIDDLRLADNELPREEAWQVVRTWMAGAQGSHGKSESAPTIASAVDTQPNQCDVQPTSNYPLAYAPPVEAP